VECRTEVFTERQSRAVAALGFAVGSTRGVVRVEKYGGGAEFRKGTDDLYQMNDYSNRHAERPVSRGCGTPVYQKFFAHRRRTEIAALATHLQNLRKFNEELLTGWASPTFYNEALGSVSQVSVYDRVKGRKGAVPDETGAHTKPVAATSIANSRARTYNRGVDQPSTS